MKEFSLSQYEDDKISTSNLDHLKDAIDLVAFLTAEDFVIPKLVQRHGKTHAQAKKLGKKISSHANIARQYLEVVISCPPAIAFLPAYYAILNLAKVCCLSGQYYGQFSAQTRWHGATYNTQGKVSRSLMTEEITVKTGGALALYYETLTGDKITNNLTLKLGEVYPIIRSISTEVSLVTGKGLNLWAIRFQGERQGSDVTIQAKVFLKSGNKEIPYRGNVRRIPPLSKFGKVQGAHGLFSIKVNDPANRSIEDVARDAVRTEFLYTRKEHEYSSCSIQRSTLPLPEDFAISLAFFHLSSVCRYNPEFLQKLTQSKAWPVMLAMRRHALKDYIFGCFSFIEQENHYFVSG